MRTILIALSFLCVSLLSSSAFAHISLNSPTARQNADLKAGPCGNGPDEDRSENVTTFTPGETITVKWEETFNHPSHYAISFSANGTDDFVNPMDQDDMARTELPVLLDGIEDKDGGDYEASVTLPMEECDNCTLQLIQVMYDKSWEEAFYYQCADIMIVGDGTTDPDGTGGADSMGAGGSDAEGAGGSDAEGSGGADQAGSGGSGTASGGAGAGGTSNAGGTSAAGGSATSAGGSSASASSAGGTAPAAASTGGTSNVAPTVAQGDEQPLPGDDEGGCSLGAPSNNGSRWLFFALPIAALGRRRFLARS